MSNQHSAYSTLLAAFLASSIEDTKQRVREVVDEDSDAIVELVVMFLANPISPIAFLEFEVRLLEVVRELARKVMQFTCNECEPDDAEDAPHDVFDKAGGYRRLKKKTPNRYVDTLFGRMTLWRRGYRYWHRDQKEPNIFPLELVLGLTRGATPALAGEICRMMGEAGATQNRTLEQGKRQFNLSMSVERLREVTDEVAEAMERFRQQYQVRKLLDLLKQAYASRGRYKPVFAVGRDGIHMPMAGGAGYRQAAVATVTVYDRNGRRLGTVYLGATPESEQPTLSRQLTALIKDCLKHWCDELGKPLPRLCYVTDAGDNESTYYMKVLSRMRDPRNTRKYLHWYRIIDYFHATEKITIMAEALFGTDRKASSWAAKMRKALLKPSGTSRVLHSAAAHAAKGLQGDADKFYGAYEYIRSRTHKMNYAEFRRMRLPIGSGITEAACKTVFTQRLKLSGMGWKHQGAQAIINLRVVLLSGIWDEVYAAAVNNKNPLKLRPHPNHNSTPERIAA